MAARTKTEHRFVRMPPESLLSPRVTWHKVHSEGHCRMCLRDERVRTLTRHHLIPESWFMPQPLKLKMVRNAHANIVPLCRGCHDLVDSKDADERIQARRMLRRTLSQQEIAFMINVRGKEWLDKEYPVM